MINDTYKTIKIPANGIYKDKGSKFLSFAYPIGSEHDFKEIQKKINKEFHDARHRCFAYRLGIEGIQRSNDDGEPSNTAGKPILGQLMSRGLTNILVYVVRYFGGTLLGVGGLINAYKESTANALENSQIVTKTIDDVFEVFFPYHAMGEVMRIIKENDLQQFDQNFNQACELKFRVRKNKAGPVLEKLKKNNIIKVNYLKTI